LNATDFVNLHTHSDFSLLDGAAKAADLAKAAKKAGQTALALTDHGTLSGSIEFFKACKKEGVRPILGCEAYLAPGLDEKAHLRKGENEDGSVRRDEAGRKKSFDYAHFTLLAKNEAGWRNLSRLSSIAAVDGFYYRPRMSWALLTKYHEGLIALSGCLSGQLANEIKVGKYAEAEQHARRWTDLFGPDFYMEIQPALVEPQDKVNDECLRIAKRLGIKPVVTGDVHYVKAEDAEIQEVKICVSAHKTVAENRKSGLNMPPVFFFKGAPEMSSYFNHLQEAILTTREIADKCVDFSPLPGKFYLPKFTTPDGSTAIDYFKRLCHEGLVQRFGVKGAEERRARLDYEIGCILKTGFVDYFLIVQDLINWARSNGVPVGPGRGSAAGSLASYCLRITNLDPLRYGLIFERFMNPERVSMPDIDIDFDERNREKVIEYVKRRYGKDSVAQIATFGESKVKSAIRDVGRVLELPKLEVDRLARMVPEGPKVDFEGSLASVPELKAASEDPKTKRLFDLALGLEGLRRQAGKHAAGIVIGDVPLIERIPLMRVGSGDEAGICTAFTMNECEDVGLIKMDLLGLRTITHIHDTLSLIQSSHGVHLEEDAIPVRDNHSMETTTGDHPCPVHKVPFGRCRCCDKTLDLYCKAEVNGVFQVEGSGMKKLLLEVKPDRFDDVIAILALYRPGPMGSDMHMSYARRKNGQEEIVYDHPSLEPVLGETFALFVYQEQVMKLAQVLAGFTLPEADTLRKAIGKKKADVMEKLQSKFIDGCLNQGKVSQSKATEIWAAIVKFADYCFNKSHSAAYGLISWETAWLKANYPIEFMAALLTSWSGVTDKLATYIEEARRMGIHVEAPCVNTSEARFSIKKTKDGSSYIAYGLEAVKGVGPEKIEHLLAARQRVGGRFHSIVQLCEEVDSRILTKGVLEAFAKAGAFRSLGVRRSQLYTPVERTISSGAKGKSKTVVETPLETAARLSKVVRKEQAAGQGSLFKASDHEIVELDRELLPVVPEWDLAQVLEAEKEALGYYLTRHPLDEHRERVLEYATVEAARAGPAGKEPRNVVVGGAIRSVREILDKKQNVMAFVAIEDFSGMLEGVCFHGVWNEFKGVLTPGRVVLLDGQIDPLRDPPSIRILSVVPIEDAHMKLVGSATVEILLFKGRVTNGELEAATEIMRKNPGSRPVFFQWAYTNETRSLKRQSPISVSGTAMLRQQLQDVFGGHAAVRAGRA
jgi:DNA polymerase-3 subunit alpha